VAGLVFSPDSHQLLTFGKDRFQVFELGKSGRAAWVNADAIVSGVHHYFRSWSYLTPRFIRQGKGILTCPSSSSVQVWNLDSRQPEPPVIVDAAGLMYCVESLANDDVFVGGTKGSTILSTATPNEIRSQTLPTSTTGACMAAAYDALRHELFIGYGNRPNERWLLQDKHQQPCFSTSPNGCLTAAFSPDGRMLAVVNYDWDIFIWENSQTSTDDFTVNLDDGGHHADFSADSRYVAVTSFKTAACVYDLRTKERLATLPKPADSEQLLQPLFLSNPDLLAIVVRVNNMERRIDIWNWRTGERRQSIDYPKEKSEYDFRSEVRRSADRWRLLAPSDNGVAFVLDVNSTGELTSQRIHNPIVKEWHEISPDGRLLAATTMKNKNLSIGLLYEIANNSVIAELAHDYRVPRWRFSKDSSQLATASWDNSVRIWESNTGKLISGPLPHSSPVYDAEFSQDNRHLLTYAKDATALVWDLRTGRPATAPYSGEEEVVAAFRPGHDQAIVMDAKGSFNVWDWRNSTRLWPTAQLSATQGQFWTLERTLTISSDGRFRRSAAYPRCALST
jgi:WD40 repeat protein